MTKNHLLIALGVLFAVTTVVAYIIFHESPEECFVREMRDWSQKENMTDKVQGITQDDEKMAVSKAKIIVEEYDLDDIGTEEVRNIYLRVKTLFDYCGIKF